MYLNNNSNMLSILIGFLIIIGTWGLITWCKGGEFLEGARGCGGTIIWVIEVIIAIAILIIAFG